MPFYRPGVIYLRLSGDANKWQSRHNSPSSHPDARYRACADFTGVLSPLLLREQWERDEMSRSWPSFWWLYNLAAFCDFWGTGVRYIGAAFGVGWIEYLTLGTAEAQLDICFQKLNDTHADLRFGTSHPRSNILINTTLILKQEFRTSLVIMQATGSWRRLASCTAF